MKVAVLIDTWFPFIGGGQINAWEISKALARKGTEVEIITRNCGKDFHNNLKYLKITKLGKLSKPSDSIARIKYLLRVFYYINRNDFDLVVAHAFLPGLPAKMFMILKNKPVLLVVHGTSIRTNLNQGAKALLEKFILTKIRYSAEITVSRDFLEIKNVNKNIVYIPNGVQQIFFKSNSSIKREKNSLLFVGRLHPQKNLIRLIKAMKLLSKENYPFKLTIVGEGPQKQEILNLIKKYKLGNKIKLVGPKYGLELVKYFQTSSAFILPSIYEGQPLTLLEAWATKLPPIVSKTGDAEYLIKEGANGFIIKDQYNPVSIALTIKNAFSNKNLRKLGQNGKLFVKNNFSWEQSAKATLKIYENITKS